MKKELDNSSQAKLRQRAEELARKEPSSMPENIDALPQEVFQQTLHNLRVSQIELEMQNEELIQTQVTLETAWARYFALYDLAPAGYCTISEKGLILETNLTCADMLSATRSEVVKQPFTRFIYKEDQDIYYLYIKQLSEIPSGKQTGKPCGCELRMVKKDGSTFWAHLDVTVAQDIDYAPVWRIVLSDITVRQLVEIALRESEKKYRNIFENVQDVFFETLFDDTILEVSPSIETLSKGQYCQADLIGRSVYNLFSDAKDRDSFLAAMQNKNNINDFEVRFKNRDGSSIPCSISAKMIFDAEGRSTRIIGSLRDITERKQAEEALQESEEKFSVAFKTASNAIIITQPEGGRVIEVNDAFSKISGFTREEIVNNTSIEMGFWVDEESRNRVVNELRSGGKVAGSEFKFKKKNGEIITGLFSAQLIRIKNNTYILSSINDITVRKRAEEALRKSNAYLENLINYANSSIIVWNPQFRITRFNHAAEFLTGRNEADVIGQSLEILFPPALVEDSMALIRKTMTGERWETVELKNLHRNGSIRTVLWNSATIFGSDDQMPIAVIAQGQDITERKRMEDDLHSVLAKLESSNKQLEQFAFIASHDLQEPLRMVASYTQLLAKHYEGQLDEKAKKYIAFAVDGAVRMQQLINDLLTYSRIGMQINHIEITDTHSILGEAIRNLAAVIEESKAVITHEELPKVRADVLQFVQVFQNLLANAIKFRGEDFPRVHVSARDEGSEWVFSVRDNGIGIDRQYADRIFVIFQRLHTHEEYPGTGIGLAVCKRIVEQHDGKIWFESEPRKGSTFFFTVPK